MRNLDGAGLVVHSQEGSVASDSGTWKEVKASVTTWRLGGLEAGEGGGRRSA